MAEVVWKSDRIHSTTDLLLFYVINY